MVEGFKVGYRVVVPGPGNAHVFVDNRLTLPLEPQGQTFFKDLEVQPQQMRGRAYGHGVLRQPVSGDAQFRHRQRAELYPIARFAGLDVVFVVQYPRPRPHELQVPVHRILVQAHEYVEFIAVGVYLLVTDTKVQKDMSATDDRLVSIVGVQVEAAPNEYTSKNIAWGGDALSGFTADSDRKIKTSHGHRSAPYHC